MLDSGRPWSLCATNTGVHHNHTWLFCCIPCLCSSGPPPLRDFLFTTAAPFPVVEFLFSPSTSGKWSITIQVFSVWARLKQLIFDRTFLTHSYCFCCFHVVEVRSKMITVDSLLHQPTVMHEPKEAFRNPTGTALNSWRRTKDSVNCLWKVSNYRQSDLGWCQISGRAANKAALMGSTEDSKRGSISTRHTSYFCILFSFGVCSCSPWVHC